MSINILDQILPPRSIAVVGASSNPLARGYGFVYQLLDYGFKGKIFPVHPKYAEVQGLKAYPSLIDIPEPVDYVISCIPASDVPNLLEDCARKSVKAVHLFTARLSETGRPDAAALEQEMLIKAKKLGVRLLGPNCMGIYIPGAGISFGYYFPKEAGSVGMISQSGGGAGHFLHSASLRGVRFSKAISYGNALDLNESDFLEYFAGDPETKTILIYIEGVRDGKRFFDTLRKVAAVKPVVITKGGRGESGKRLTASHTASLAGSTKTWDALISQTGAIPAKNFDEMADLAVSFSFLGPVLGNSVGVLGGGGGHSVLSADECEDAGLDVIPLPADMREDLRNKGVQIWDWVGNPTDLSILDAGFTGVDMLRAMAKHPDFDVLIANINVVNHATTFAKSEVISRFLPIVDNYVKIKQETSKPILATVDERYPTPDENSDWIWKLIVEVRAKLIAAGIPIFPTIGRAAGAAGKLANYYGKRKL